MRFFTTIRQLGVNDDDLLNIFGRAYIDLHEIALKKQKKARWADKCPENVLFINKWKVILNGELFFIHCVRHPLDALASLKEIGFTLSVPKNFADKVEIYKIFIEAGLNFEKKNPLNSFRVRYEDIVKDPKSLLYKLMNFIGEEFEEGMLEFYLKKHQVGLEDPKISFTKGVHQESVGRGLKVLTNNEINIVVGKCKKLFEKLGYELPDIAKQNSTNQGNEAG